MFFLVPMPEDKLFDSNKAWLKRFWKENENQN